jgi:hypothetical protein
MTTSMALAIMTGTSGIATAAIKARPGDRSRQQPSPANIKTIGNSCRHGCRPAWKSYATGIPGAFPCRN